MTYFLLTLVVGVWGYVIYTVLAKVQEPDKVIPQQASASVAEVDLSYYRWRDSLAYDTVRTSPFAEFETAGSSDANAELLLTQEVPYSSDYDPLMYVPALDIQYLGFIENKKQKQRLALIQMDGKQYYLRVKQRLEGITLLQIAPDEIRILLDGHSLTINKQ